MTVRLGWYIHHHGSGHLTRALAVAPHLDAQVRCFSSLPRPAALPPGWSWTTLPRDDDTAPGQAPPREADPSVAHAMFGGMLHWAPLGHAGHRARLATIAHALADDPVDAVVVDVSVEITLLVRLLGVRAVVFAQPGDRTDEPHRLAYRAASAIIAPWPIALLRPPALEPFADRVVYTGGISRFADRAPAAVRGTDVVLLGGRGGSSLTDADVAAAGEASGRRWVVLGGGGTGGGGTGVAAAGVAAAGVAGAAPAAGWRADPWPELSAAGVVVAWAGQNSVADLAAAGARAVIVPQERPFAEQVETARAVGAAGLAVVAPTWPRAEEWPGLLARADALRPDWSRWEVEGAAERAATAIVAAAGRA